MANALQQAFDVLLRLEATNSRLIKESILEANADNEALRTIIRMALGTDRYYVWPSVNIICDSSLSPAQSWVEFKALTSRLKNKECTGDTAKKETRRFLSKCYPQLMVWYCRILNHDLRIGVGRETIEKVWGSTFLLTDSVAGMVWEHRGCASPQKYSDVYGVAKPSFPFGVESRLSGVHVNVICFPRNDQAYVFTTEGQRIETAECVQIWCAQVLDLCRRISSETDPNRPLFLDGIFQWRPGAQSDTTEHKPFDSGIFLEDVRVVFWDWSPLERYMEGCYNVKWLLRKSTLLYAAGAERPTETIVHYSNNVSVVGHTMVYAEDPLKTEYERRLEAGHKGAVLKNPDAPHVFASTVDVVEM